MGKNGVDELKKRYEIPRMSERQVNDMKEKMEKAKRENKRNRRKTYFIRIGTAAAAAIAAFIILPNTSANVAYAMEKIPLLGNLIEVVTFRDYEYESDRNMADVEVPKLVPEAVADTETDSENSEVSENLKKSTDEINAEIEALTDKWVTEFEKNISDEGYQDILIKHEVINTTQDYFTLKLICYQGAGSGAEWHYFYTIDLNTGERLQLKDLFTEGADYITPISENIKSQMGEQMAADENVMYWVDYTEVPDWNFEKITDDTAFYVDAEGRIVISFNEGDVAPMYMGVVEFTIPDDVTADIRK